MYPIRYSFKTNLDKQLLTKETLHDVPGHACILIRHFLNEQIQFSFIFIQINSDISPPKRSWPLSNQSACLIWLSRIMKIHVFGFSLYPCCSRLFVVLRPARDREVISHAAVCLRVETGSTVLGKI